MRFHFPGVCVAILVLTALPCLASAPVPIGHDTLPALVVTAKMRRYATTEYALYFAGTIYGLLVLWVILHTGLSARLSALAQRGWLRVRPLRRYGHRLGRRRRRTLTPRGRRLWVVFLYGPRCVWRHSWLWLRRLVQAVFYGVLLTICLAIAHFPLHWYGSYFVEHQYGLSHQNISGWLRDYGTDIGPNLLIGLVCFPLLWLVTKSPRRWSLWLWAALVPLLAFIIFLAPILFDPINNTFTPLPPGPLHMRLEQLAAKAGIPNAPLYVADQSRRTTTDNAYVTGLGTSARIVVWDNTLKDLDQEEIAGVAAHEMGHYALGHVRRGFWQAALGLLAALPLLQWLVTRLIKKHGKRWHIAHLHDLPAIPAYLFALALLTFLSQPFINYFSRQIEHQADAYGLALCGDGPAMARAFAFFASHDLDDPKPPTLIKYWLYSHPPLGERIHFVLSRKSPLPSRT